VAWCKLAGSTAIHPVFESKEELRMSDLVMHSPSKRKRERSPEVAVEHLIEVGDAVIAIADAPLSVAGTKSLIRRRAGFAAGTDMPSPLT
jgi:hypothetical protein